MFVSNLIGFIILFLSYYNCLFGFNITNFLNKLLIKKKKISYIMINSKEVIINYSNFRIQNNLNNN